MIIKPHYRLYSCFLLFSLITGAMYSRLPDIQSALGVNEAELGATLIGAAIGSLISLTLCAPLIEKLGARLTSYITLIGSTACYCAVAFISWAPLAFFALFVAGLLVGALEVNLNVQIGRQEIVQGRSMMSRAHGFWSLGFFITSLLAAAIRQAGISAQWHLGVAFVLVTILAVISVSGIEHTPAPPNLARPDETEKAPLFAFPTLALLPLCLIGLVAFLIEGAGVDWSAIYMRDAFHADPFVGGLGLSFFAAVMAVGRLTAGSIVDRLSPRLVVGVLLGVSIVGLCAVWLAPHPYVALAGFALLGGGCSAIYPLVVSAAAQRTDRPSPINVAAVGQISFVVFFLAPPFLGFIAYHFGIRQSYLVCLPLVIASMLMITALPARGRAPRPGEPMPEPLTPNG
jgi:MFS family permease